MKAVRLYEPHDLRVTDIDDPKLEPGMVEVDIAYTGICGSDVHEYKIGPVPIRAEDRDHEIPESEWEEHLPKNMGHEIAGTVAAVGDEVANVSVGDDVALNILLSCGECQYCHDGKVQLCTAYDGATVDSAGFAESIVVPAEAAVPVPDAVLLRHAALAEPMSVSLHAVRRSNLRAGDNVAVFGAGPIGLGIVDAAIAAGANRVLISEPRAARREIAADLGASFVVDPQTEDPVDRFSELVGGVDVAFEIAGVDETLTQALRSTKYDGAVVVVSVFEEHASIHPNDVMQAERTVTGAFAYVDEFPITLSMMADGRLSPEKLITGTVSLEDVDDAFQSLVDPESTDVKVLVEP